MLLAMIAWGVLLASPRDRWLTRVILGATFSSLVASLWATVTRAYLLALLVACFFLLCRSFRWRVRLIAAAIIILAIGVSSIWIRDKRRLGWLDEDDGYRTMMWKDSIGLIAKHPILGVGWDSVFTHGKAWGLEAYQRFPKRASHFHSTPIQIAVDSGILGLAAWCWLMAVYLRLLTKLLTANSRGDWFSRGLTYGIFGSTIAFLLGSIVHYTLGDGEVMALMWLLMGAAVVLARTVAGTPEAKAAPVLAYDSYAAVRSN
jgi:O-antigen ligase